MIEYEWAIEDVDTETGKILDVDTSEDLGDFYAEDLDDAIKQHEVEPGVRLQLVLYRSNYRRQDLRDRTTSRVIDGKLEIHFHGTDGAHHAVPARFNRELKQYV